jgi:hypothetical protein
LRRLGDSLQRADSDRTAIGRQTLIADVYIVTAGRQGIVRLPAQGNIVRTARILIERLVPNSSIETDAGGIQCVCSVSGVLITDFAFEERLTSGGDAVVAGRVVKKAR